ncbi:hypothetical protein [Candidatus Magnetominusculus dajiuhuensis]|uniref:hypothetical protein n=1 Tax=Candidatus Magnetominusculus dajiuhuensis TaxID=3137712 RepID=UPI003B42E963
MNPSQARLADIAMVFAVVLAGIKLTYGLERFLDIGLYDESVYLYKGVMLASLGIPPPDSGPLYKAWYWVLSLFVKDNIKLYYLNYRIMAIAPAVLLYCLMRTYRTPMVVSLVVTFFYLISFGNLSVWPKPSHFAIVIALALFTIKRHIPSNSKSALFLAGGTLLMSYARPEFFMSYVMFIGFYIVYAILKRRVMLWREELPALILLAVMSLSLFTIFGVPVSGENNRSWNAFGQHFSLNLSKWQHTDKNPWLDWETIVREPFGDAHSVAGAFIINPSAFIKHAGYNIVGLVHTVFGVFLMHFNVILPSRTGAKFVMEGYVLAALLIVAGFYFRKRLVRNFRENFNESKMIILCSSFIVAPSLISLVIIYPRYHYALIVGVFAAFVAAVVFSLKAPQPIQKNAAISYALLFVLLTPYSSPNPYFNYTSNNGQLQNVETIKFIRALNISKPVNMLEAEGGIAYYLGRNYGWIADWSKNTGFYQFLKSNGINMIVLSEALHSDSRFAGDKQWQDFLSNPRGFGFIQLYVSGTTRQLLVQEYLIKQ